ncbi:Methyltransferase type 11 [Penicillium cf. griseofulvum]|nr:Methyltransferase type 11 [Penicillium cf. griseofulvum]
MTQTLLETPLHPGRSERGSESDSSLDEIAQEKQNALLATLGHRGKDLENSASPKRWKSFWSAFRHLARLTPKQVDDFMASYIIYNLDWSDEKQMTECLGPNYKEKVGDCLKSYYGVLNHLPKSNVLENQILYERSIARDIGLGAGKKVLDLGCGRGRVAAHMAQYTGAQVTGLNIDPDQVEQATSFNRERGLQNNFIQALSLCKDLPALFREIFRVIKPGSKISLLDWISLSDYDASNPEHAELMRRVKPLIGAVGTPTQESLESALKEAGFEIVRSENASIDGLQAPLIDTVDVYFRTLRQAILALVKVHVLPRHFKTLINRLCLDGQAFVKMDRMRLATTSYSIIAQKPRA